MDKQTAPPSPDELPVLPPEIPEAKSAGKLPLTRKERIMRLVSIIMVILIVGGTILAYMNRHRIHDMVRYGLPGIFLVEFIANASIVLPIPGALVTAALSPLVPPIALILVSSLAAALGELTGYAAGMGGKQIIENAKWHDNVERWMKKFGGLTIVVMAAIPNPLFDIAGVTAGLLRMNVLYFFFCCWLGKIINRTVVVLGGSTLIGLIPWMQPPPPPPHR